MKRLHEDFERAFDLDHEIGGVRLGDLIQATLGDVDADSRPTWGTPGQRDAVATADSPGLVRFYYMPHLFPEMEVKLRLAHKLQFEMLPRELPRAAPMSIAAVLESYCHLSGDLFGWEMLEDGRFLLWIVDLAGHGVASGIASATLRVILKATREREDLGRMVTDVNAAFRRCSRSGSLFATGVFIAVTADGVLSYTSAGHPPVLIRSKDGRLRQLDSNSIPLGIFSNQHYPVRETRLEEGETLLLYTDGVLEGPDGDEQMFGMERLRRFLGAADGTPDEIAQALYKTIAGHQDMAKLSDDTTFVVAQMLPPDPA